MRAILAVGALALAGALGAPAPAAYAATPPPTVVSITFDDGFASQMRAAPILKRFGLRATFYVNSELLNGANRLSFADVRRLASAGHEIGGHTSDHTDLVTVDAGERTRQVCDDRVALGKITGSAPRSFAYPYGAYDVVTQRIVADCGYSSARGVGGLVNPNDCVACPLSETVAPDDRLAIRTSYSFVASTRARDAEQVIEQAMRHGGGWVPFVFHEVCDNCSEMGVRPAELRALLAWISAHRRSGVVVRTVGGVVGGTPHPLISAPKHAGPYGKLVNAHLGQAGAATGAGPDVAEDGIDASEVTRCWRRAGYGESQATWTRAPVGIHGTMAETVSVSNYVSGDRKLLVRPDGGSCSVRVRKGVVYRISVWYKATARVSLTAYTRGSAGRWHYWVKSPPARTSKGWSRLSLDLPPVAAGVENISFGATIAGNGHMTVDNFAVAEAPPAAIAHSPIVLGLDVGSRSFAGVVLSGLLFIPVIGAAAYDRLRRRW